MVEPLFSERHDPEKREKLSSFYEGVPNFLALRVFVGLRVAGTGWGHYVTRMPRASKLRGLVKPWAVPEQGCVESTMDRHRPSAGCRLHPLDWSLTTRPRTDRLFGFMPL